MVSHCLPQTTISRKQLLFQPQAPQLALSPTLSTFAGDGTQAVKESHFEWIPDAFSVDFFRDGQKKGWCFKCCKDPWYWRYPHIVCKDTYSNGMIVVNLKSFKVFFWMCGALRVYIYRNTYIYICIPYIHMFGDTHTYNAKHDYSRVWLIWIFVFFHGSLQLAKRTRCLCFLQRFQKSWPKVWNKRARQYEWRYVQMPLKKIYRYLLHMNLDKCRDTHAHTTNNTHWKTHTHTDILVLNTRAIPHDPTSESKKM